jgi:hypothetical protein
MSFIDLPSDVFPCIASFLNVGDRETLRRVSRDFHSACLMTATELVVGTHCPGEVFEAAIRARPAVRRVCLMYSARHLLCSIPPTVETLEIFRVQAKVKSIPVLDTIIELRVHDYWQPWMNTAFPNVTRLHLDERTFPRSGLMIGAMWTFPFCSKLRSLEWMARGFITTHDSALFCSLFPMLEHIRICAGGMEPAPILTALARHCPNLQTIDFTGSNRISATSSLDSAQIEAAVTSLQHLRAFHLWTPFSQLSPVTVLCATMQRLDSLALPHKEDSLATAAACTGLRALGIAFDFRQYAFPPNLVSLVCVDPAARAVIHRGHWESQPLPVTLRQLELSSALSGAEIAAVLAACPALHTLTFSGLCEPQASSTLVHNLAGLHIKEICESATLLDSVLGMTPNLQALAFEARPDIGTVAHMVASRCPRLVSLSSPRVPVGALLADTLSLQHVAARYSTPDEVERMLCVHGGRLRTLHLLLDNAIACEPVMRLVAAHCPSLVDLRIGELHDRENHESVSLKLLAPCRHLHRLALCVVPPDTDGLAYMFPFLEVVQCDLPGGWTDTAPSVPPPSALRVESDFRQLVRGLGLRALGDNLFGPWTV